MSINITFANNQSFEFQEPISGLEVAEKINSKLKSQALAMTVNGQLMDIYSAIDHDAVVEIIDRDHDLALELIRHDCAHILAQAVKSLFPETQVSIGPTIENGFYYDFFREESFTPDDLKIIEKKMHDLVKQNLTIQREVWSRNDAIDYFKAQGEHFKAELISDLPESEIISVYHQGDFIDLCRGPHLPSTRLIGNGFKLTTISGSYWRGDTNNAQMQRIYGTAWRSRDELKAHLKRLEEAERRDHRKLGRLMQLFHFQEEAVGSIFWHPRGWRLYQNLERFMRERMEKAGYQEVSTPQLVDRTLWEASGHWDKFQDNMFTTQDESRIFALKPMNCPGAVQIFKQGVTSYRELPLRFSEFNTLHRNELSGALHGMLRLRSFRQDDAHIFCTEDQINEETRAFCDFVLSTYQDFGFTDVKIKFADRPAVRAGTDETWEKAETALKDAVTALGLQYSLNPGEGAFYGPKLEFALRDAIGRDWQCGTLQVDFVMPERLNAHYIDQAGNKVRPVMLHRAALGSLERFLGILIESNAGHLPLWLSPVPVVITTITGIADRWAKEVHNRLQAQGVKAELDLRNETIGYKVREHSKTKIPQIWVIGEQEANNQQVAIRRLGSQQNEVQLIDEAIAQLLQALRCPNLDTRSKLSESA